MLSILRLILFSVLLVAAVSASGQKTYIWCWNDGDDIWAEVDGETGDITVHHDAVAHNCASGLLGFDVTLDGDVLRVVENIHEGFAFCYCCFDFEGSITGLAPGEYTLIYTWVDFETESPNETILTVVVPDPAQPADPAVAGIAQSDCLDSSSVIEDPEPLTTWGSLKSRYR